MASPNAGHSFLVLALLLCFSAAYGELSENYYQQSAPACKSLNLTAIVRNVLDPELKSDRRMGASLLRLFFHDCFPQGCDASVLLVDNKTRGIDSEQNAGPNANSLRGFDVIDKIKTAVEANCAGVVSCADILAVAARESVNILGGQRWTVRLGRRDSLQAFKDKANSDLPSPSFTLQQLKDAFKNKNFTASEMVALSGGHTIGMARCQFEADGKTVQQAICPASTILNLNSNSTMVPLDTTSKIFDNQYYADLDNGKGVLNSDRVLVANASDPAAGQVKGYSTNKDNFFKDFANAMFKMSEMGVLTGSQGQIRLDCKRLN